ncbi:MULTISPECIES: hemolysin family protein [unclassified Crossiella]|uniref:hemolysin family protein n=1 Tax=unclassified Crossiella TaxID=2620835 RepID=UPI001FFECBB3|nr:MULTISPECIES: hemolysin family protein [unclassified Crossiella]MCK2237749.1 hemolysin family protein [Crossiella sp. S99.2]MCK2255035.1 hemolysin family protein [Crossiella sp. S99.1]
MDGYWLNLALVAFLILVNALFAGSEIALISLREGQLRQLERRGGRTARVLIRLTRDPNRFLAAIQLAITLSGALASATAAVTLAQPLVPALSFAGEAAGPLAVALVTLVLTFFTLVFGELAPKRLAMQYAHRWAMLVARPLDLIATIARPAIWALSRSTNVVVRLFGGNPEAGSEQLSPEELRDLVAGHRGLNAEQRMIITGALEIHERLLRHVLVPRRNVFVVPADATVQEARRMLADSGHSRAPVVRSGHLDDVAGVVHLRELLDDSTTVLEVTRAATIFPDTLRVSDALRQFKATHQQFALVVDERGAVDGIVTLEDLLEEIVGEIYDETDRDIMAVRTEPDGALLLPGTFPVHDLIDLGVELSDAPEGDYTTIAGLALIALRRIPDQPGDRVELAEWTLEITAVDRHAITEIRLRPKAKRAED